LLTLASSDANKWHLHIDPAAATSVSYVSVTDSDAGGYKLVDASNGTNVDGGGGGTNINWKFEPDPKVLNMDGVNLEGIELQ
jgi:hypothetical protein